MHRFLAIGAIALLALALCGGAAAWSWPADGDVLRPFVLGADAYAGGQHRGVDVAGPDGSPVRAPASGVVTFAGALPTYGQGVTVLTADGYSVTLVHLGGIGVSKGDTVAEGATVGTMGFSGTPEQSVPSVHLGIRRASEEEGYVDPLGLLPPRTAPAPQAADPEPAPAASPVPVTPAVPVQPAEPPPAPAPAGAPPAPETSVAAAPEPASPVMPAAPAPVRPPATTPAAMPSAALPTAAGPALATQPEPSRAPSSGTPPAPDDALQSSRPEALSPHADAFVVNGEAHPPAAVHAAAVHGAAPPARSRQAADARPTRGLGAQPAPAAGPAPANGVAAERGKHAAVRAAAERPSPTPTALAPGPAGASRLSRTPQRPDHVAHASDGRGERAVRGVAEKGVGAPARHGAAHPKATPSAASSLGPADAGAAALASDGRAAPAVAHAAAPGGIGAPEVAAAIVLGMLLAAVVARRVARRIGWNGAVLRHHADLLRQLDAAYRTRLHDRGRGRLRTPSAAARS